jgi:glycosyltransferase involved in cell wall biosynthesis
LAIFEPPARNVGNDKKDIQNNMIKVLFDHQKFSEQKYGGISRIFAHLVGGIKKSDEFASKLGVLYADNYYIKDEPQPLNNALGRFLLKKAKRAYKWNKWYSKYLIKKNDFDVFHPTYFHPYFLKHINKPYVLTVHDMIYERLPDYFPLTDPLPGWKKETVQRAAGVIAISESTKRDLVELLKVPEDKVTVIHHGIDPDAALNIEVVQGLPSQYLLFVGERGNYKNFFRYINCCGKLAVEYPNLHFVFAGGGKFQASDSAFIERLNLTGKCTQLNATDAQLNYLYQNAAFFVFPSLYEGFGLPLLEAFKAGCAVASSNTSCFPEIGGDAVCYFDPMDEQNMLEAFKLLLDKPDQKAAYIEKGTERVKLFSLQKQIDATLALYKKVAQQIS